MYLILNVTHDLLTCRGLATRSYSTVGPVGLRERKIPILSELRLQSDTQFLIGKLTAGGTSYLGKMFLARLRRPAPGVFEGLTARGHPTRTALQDGERSSHKRPDGRRVTALYSLEATRSCVCFDYRTSTKEVP